MITRLCFVILSYLPVLFVFLVIYEWNVSFNWLFAASIPVWVIIIYIPFVLDFDQIFPGPIGKSFFEKILRHVYVIVAHSMISLFLTAHNAP